MKSHEVSRRRCALAVALCAGLAATPSTALAARDKLTAAERSKMFDVILLLEQALKGCAANKLKDTLGNGAGQIEYEQVRKNGVNTDATFQDAINHLKGMLDRDNIRTDALGGFGTVDVENGIDADVIVIRKGLLTKLCNAATPAAEKMEIKTQLVATLANELTHVFQKWKGSANAILCDGERDSDCMTIKALQPLLDSMCKPDGTPHTTVGDVRTDAQYVTFLGLCLENNGATSAADLAKVKDAIKKKLGSDADPAKLTGYKGRKKRFGDTIAAGNMWNDWYGARRDEPVALQPTENEVTGTSVRLVGNNLTDVRDFNAPPGQFVSTGAGFTTFVNPRGAMILATYDTAGARTFTIYRDDDNDGLPEAAPIGARVISPSSPVVYQRYDINVFPEAPAQLNPMSPTPGVIIHDRRRGELYFLALQPDGAPQGVPVLILSDPALLDVQLLRTYNIDGGTVRIVVGTYDSGEPVVAFFDVVSTGGGFVTSPVVTNASLAEAEGIQANAGVEDLAIGFLETAFVGPPGSIVTLFDVGNGFVNPLTSEIINLNGVSGPVFVFTSGSSLFRTQSDVGDPEPQWIWEPALGTAIDCAVNDENGDGLQDRVHLAIDPPRITVFTASDFNPGAFNSQGNVALERTDVLGIRSFTDTDRSLVIEENEGFQPISQIRVFGQPTLVQSLHDFNGDGVSDEAAVIDSPGGGSGGSFNITLYRVAPDNTGQFLTTAFLPFGFQPGAISYPDVNFDGLPDVRIADFFGGPDVCFEITFSGGFLQITQTDCSAPTLCIGDADGDSFVSFSDITSVLANLGRTYPLGGQGPGDANADGFVNFNDITIVLANLGAFCF